MTPHRGRLPDAAATEALGENLAAALGEGGAVIYLRGDLGAGKTTLVRGLLRALGYEGRVRSPTYTLVEPYELHGRRIFHTDLYRLKSPGELAFLGLSEVDPGNDILIVEWPERADTLPAADIDLQLGYLADGNPGRELEFGTGTARGRRILENLK